MAEKAHDISHVEEARQHSEDGKSEFDERAPEAKGRDMDALPKGYWYR